jgi:hypothetical protein
MDIHSPLIEITDSWLIVTFQPAKTNCLNRQTTNTCAEGYLLYQNDTYSQLASRFGLQKLYILSAGWGLITADFRTPYYDITFSPSAVDYKRRRKSDHLYQDFCMLPRQCNEPVFFFGGKDYVPLFCKLTSEARGERTVFYNSAQPPLADGCILKRFETTTRTNWHYECAKQFLKELTNDNDDLVKS